MKFNGLQLLNSYWMKESNFIKQNQEKWADIEQEMAKTSKDPEKLSRLFVQLTDDLSYSRTYYKNRTVRVYLNGVAQRLFRDIYKNEGFRFSGFLNFWKEELPMAVYRSRRSFLISFLVFAIAMAVGVFSAIQKPEFIQEILGKDYVDMTMDNIEQGNPMGVYEGGGELTSFLAITQNNIRVAFLCFISGIFAAMGTLMVLLYNGVMVGVFQYMFVEEGLFRESFLTIWQHGTLEISAIVISGAAGLTLGRGLLFPGTYSRLQAFRLSGMQALKIMMGVVPVFIMAGFIEGYFTRHTDVHDGLRLLVILFSLGFILLYYGWYPRRVASKYINEEEEYTDDLPVESNYESGFGQLKTASEIFEQSFSMLLKHLLQMVAIVGLSAALYVGILWSTEMLPYNSDWAMTVPGGRFIGILPIAFCLSFVSWLIYKNDKGEGGFTAFLKKNILSILLISLLTSLLLTSFWGYGLLICWPVVPFLLLIFFVAQKESIPVYKALPLMFSYIKGSFSKVIGLWFRITVVSFFIMLFTRIVILNYVVSTLNDILGFTPEGIEYTELIATITDSLWFYLGFMLLTLVMGLLYDTLKETITAEALHQRISHIGNRVKLMGLELENKKN